MPEAKTDLTDQELIEKLRASVIDDVQKKELEELIPDLNTEERTKLINLINDAEQEMAPFKEQQDEALRKLNAEYTEKLENITKETNEHARKEFEKLEKEEDTEEMKELEEEVSHMEPEKKEEVKPKAVKSDDKSKPKTKHSLRTVLLIVLGLVIVAAGAALALMFL